MRAVIVEEPGDVEALTIKETPTPTPQPGEVLVRTVAAGVNRADLLQRRGYYPPRRASPTSSVWRPPVSSRRSAPV